MGTKVAWEMWWNGEVVLNLLIVYPLNIPVTALPYESSKVIPIFIKSHVQCTSYTHVRRTHI